ncbi:hypothetical protein P376_0150 [Streptomyces sp. HCCB10043]|nr:hypothetical protein P376_0150 [Streptomyces sp. HCCB10043]
MVAGRAAECDDEEEGQQRACPLRSGAQGQYRDLAGDGHAGPKAGFREREYGGQRESGDRVHVRHRCQYIVHPRHGSPALSLLVRGALPTAPRGFPRPSSENTPKRTAERLPGVTGRIPGRPVGAPEKERRDTNLPGNRWTTPPSRPRPPRDGPRRPPPATIPLHPPRPPTEHGGSPYRSGPR